jgi:protoporphyrin/coproporphyrin ferrochelatase
MPDTYDALLIVSFGGPDGPDDVLPFLENVLRGRNVPRARMLEVADHYFHFGGKSPINELNRKLIAALQAELAAHGPALPIYWGNRNWHPLLVDTLRQMAADGVRRALAFVTSAFSSYSGCRQYREDIARAQQEVGPSAPAVDKLRVFYNHPGFIEPMIERTKDALAQIPTERRAAALLLFTAHSIPRAMAEGSRYEAQLREACRLVAAGVENSLALGERAGVRAKWQLVYQSRSGPPQQLWLEPDVCEFIRGVQVSGFSAQQPATATDAIDANPQSAIRNPQSQLPPIRDVVVVPIGFLSDHLEVIYDLDTEAQRLCHELGINMVRAATVGTHPRFIRMIRELIVERMTESADRPALGTLGPNPDVCPDDCCLYTPTRPPQVR